MTSQTNYVKIRVLIPLKGGDIKEILSDGKFIGSPEFNELLYEADQKFREPIITFINDEIGTHTWAIKFIQFDEDGEYFDVYLYCDSEIEAMKIKSIILEKMNSLKFNWYYKGDISNTNS